MIINFNIDWVQHHSSHKIFLIAITDLNDIYIVEGSGTEKIRKDPRRFFENR